MMWSNALLLSVKTHMRALGFFLFSFMKGLILYLCIAVVIWHRSLGIDDKRSPAIPRS